MTALTRLSQSFQRKPVSTGARVFLAIVAFVLVREFGQGFLDGMIEGFTDGI